MADPENAGIGWALALDWIILAINRSPHTSLNKRTPYEMFFGRRHRQDALAAIEDDDGIDSSGSENDDIDADEDGQNAHANCLPAQPHSPDRPPADPDPVTRT